MGLPADLNSRLQLIMNTTPEEVFAGIGGQPNSCTLLEYCAFAQHVQRIEFCRLLVFGVGRDSAAWRRLNQGNTTLFIENNEEWIDRIGKEIGQEHILTVTYQQRFEDWEQAGFAADKVALPGLNDTLFDRGWDCVFVDAPWGPTYGRHQSTYAATRAVAPGGLIALHDCERKREQTICRILLEEKGFQLVKEVERLRIYRAPSAT